MTGITEKVLVLTQKLIYNMRSALMKKVFRLFCFFDTLFKRKIIKFISNHFIKHFQIIKRRVSLTKIENNVIETAGRNTLQEPKD